MVRRDDGYKEGCKPLTPVVYTCGGSKRPKMNQRVASSRLLTLLKQEMVVANRDGDQPFSAYVSHYPKHYAIEGNKGARTADVCMRPWRNHHTVTVVIRGLTAYSDSWARVYSARLMVKSQYKIIDAPQLQTSSGISST